MRRMLLFSTTAALFVAAWAITANAPATLDIGADQATAPGYRVYIDPTSGLLSESPARGVEVILDQAVANGLRTSDEGLLEVPSAIPNGGTMVDLSGRYQNASTAVIDSDGNLSAPCVSGHPADGSDNN